MPDNNFTTPMTSEECLNYIRPSTERQFITPVRPLLPSL